jgi:hypothetical protein
VEENIRRGMKAKTIRKILRDRIDAWIESIVDPAVMALAKRDTIVTGGCIASMLLGERVNDIDIYFKTKETAEAVANHYVKIFHPKNKHGIPCAISVVTTDDRVKVVIKSSGIASEEGAEAPYTYFERSGETPGAAGYVGEVMSNPGDIEDRYQETEDAALAVDNEEGKPAFRPVFMSTNAITLSGRVQIVLRFFGEPEAIHENYDFAHCTNYWTRKDDELVLRPAAMEALLARELRYVGSKYPICSVIRLRKFIKRGWTINAGQILKMCMQISELDLTKIEVLEDQLTGVDAAYFAEVIHKLKAADTQTLNSAYLVEIIDRMF